MRRGLRRAETVSGGVLVILVFVFDGLRPDLVTAEVMPALWELRQRGAWFSRSHCAFPSVTRVNAASLAAGSYPATHGIPSNTLYLRAADGGPGRFASTGDDRVLRGLRREATEPLLAVPTLAQVAAAHSRRTVVVGTGSPGCAYLLHPEVAHCGGAIYHHSFVEPVGLARLVDERIGSRSRVSESSTPADLAARLDYAVQALEAALLPEVGPELVYFWCTVPDALIHRHGMGSPEVIQGLRHADAVLDATVAALERHAAAPIDVVVTADHGYATVQRHVDVQAALAAAFPATIDRLALTVDGGAGHVFLLQPDPTLREDVAEFLRAQDWVSAVLTREETAGALPLAAALGACARSADIVFCFDWQAAPNGAGVVGLSAGGGGIAVGAGDHGGGSPFEMRNLLLAAGPSFARGEYAVPAGIVDVAPTICALLRLEPPGIWNGRVLAEALAGGRGHSGPALSTSPESHVVARGTGTLKIEQIGDTRYVNSIGRNNPAPYL